MVERRAIVEQWRKRRDDTAVTGHPGAGRRIILSPARRPHVYSPDRLRWCDQRRMPGGEVSRKAAWIARNGPAVERYSTLFDEILDETNSLDTREIPYGLGCGGVMDVLLEPVASAEANAMLRALEAAERGETLYSATVLPTGANQSPGFARVILREDGTYLFCHRRSRSGDVVESGFAGEHRC